MQRLERIVFFGTPEFALPTLEALQTAGRTPQMIVTQPDRPAGRGRGLTSPPVALWARARGVPLLQTRRVRRAAALEQIESLKPQLAVVVAFGQIFPPALLGLPEHGSMNLHASLLPRHRGAAPIAAAIAAGDAATGVTSMWMEEGLDTGPILLQAETPIGPTETTGELSRRLAHLGAELVLRSIEELEPGNLEARPQDEALATYAPPLAKADGEVDWALSATQIYNRLRAFNPWPGLTARLRQQPVKLIWGRPLDVAIEPIEPGATAPEGTYLGLVEDCLAVRCGQGTLFGVERLQRPGKAVVEARAFQNGAHLEVGEVWS